MSIVILLGVINYLNRDELDIPISAGVSELFNMDDEKIREMINPPNRYVAVANQGPHS